MLIGTPAWLRRCHETDRRPARTWPASDPPRLENPMEPVAVAQWDLSGPPPDAWHSAEFTAETVLTEFNLAEAAAG